MGVEMNIVLKKEFLEVKSLLDGIIIPGQHAGVEYVIKCKWGEDWCAEVEVVSFKVISSDLLFWNKLFELFSSERLNDILSESLLKLPEVIAFKGRIDACKEIDDDLLDEIFDILNP
jgi:hypothetical protein